MGTCEISQQLLLQITLLISVISKQFLLTYYEVSEFNRINLFNVKLR
jgi:hypothetical protein